VRRDRSDRSPAVEDPFPGLGGGATRRHAGGHSDRRQDLTAQLRPARKRRLPLHTVSAWATGQRLVLGQESVAGKSNEITAIPLLLRRLELTAALVTIDAMGAQKEVAYTILDGGGNYILSLKENWPATHAEAEKVSLTRRQPWLCNGARPSMTTTGRIETRRHTLCHTVDWLFSNRRYPGEFQFPGLAAVGTIESEAERGCVIEKERRYYLCSSKLDAETLARALRGHWGTENRLHWVSEVVFLDALARLRSGHGPAHMAIVKHPAMHLLTQAKPTTSLKKRRKRAGWNSDSFEKNQPTHRMRHSSDSLGPRFRPIALRRWSV
jgi:predicted transposase YbfD/YdcC